VLSTVLADDYGENVSAELEVAAARARVQLAEEIDVALAGTLNLRRAALRLLTLLRANLADWAMLLMPDARIGGLALYGGADAAFDDVVARESVADKRIGRLLRTGSRDMVSSATRAVLADMVPHPRLADEAAALSPADLLALSLKARGTTFGALVIIRRQGFSADDVAFAERIAGRAAVALDSARLYQERAHVADVLTRGLRPPALPEIDGARIAARYRPAAEHLDIGGDFYDVLGSDRDWLLTLGDVCGKGVEAAALTGRTRQSIRTAAHFDGRPTAVLRALNTVLCQSGVEQFVTVLCAKLHQDPDGRHADVEIAVAGHPAPIVLRANGKIDEIEIFGTAIGMVPDVTYRSVSVRLHRGDTMLMFTDGVEEAGGERGRAYGMARLVALLPAYAGAAPDVVCEAVEQDVIEYLDGSPHDDLALLAVTCGT
jgi:phosphoserine phosphatase RsbU/P